jgi:hypothetical protein
VQPTPLPLENDPTQQAQLPWSSNNGFGLGGFPPAQFAYPSATSVGSGPESVVVVVAVVVVVVVTGGEVTVTVAVTA